MSKEEKVQAWHPFYGWIEMSVDEWKKIQGNAWYKNRTHKIDT